MSTNFDAIIIGAGQAGPPLAGRLTAAGWTVALIERERYGGTCVNTGCTPTKTLVASAYVAHLARHAGDYGVEIAGAITIDMATVMARKDAVVETSRSGIEGWLKGMQGCSLFEGQARFVSSHAVRVGERTLSAERIFINVGGRATVPDMPGIDAVKPLTNTTILALDHVPEHLVIIGGSYIGLEFAQIFRRFGAAVTVVEKGPRLIPREDEDVSTAVKQILEAEGIVIRLDAECIRFAQQGKHIGVGIDCTAGDPELQASHVLLAVGRQPNTDDLGLASAGVDVDAKGYILVDDDLRTSAPHIFAMGDCNGKGAFTHTAYNDFEIIAANLLDGESRRVSARIPGYALYIDPPLGRVGMSEHEAQASGHRVRVGMRPMTRVSRATEKGETQGFMKIVVDADTDAILGAAILGVSGDEAIHGVLDMMNAKAPYPVLRWAVPIHPTVSELIPTLLMELGPVR